MTIQEWASLYLKRGWQVVPLAPNSKDCWHKDWPSRTFEPEHFGEDANLGIKPLGGLVTIDLDADEAVALADELLPETGAIFGRAGKPRGKRLYTCTGLEKTRQLKDNTPGVAKAMLLEVRVGPGFQDMAPPSIHPNGERLEWVNGEPGEATSVPGDLLLARCQLLATAALAARHWPNPGKRHDWTLAFAGTLRKFEVSEEDATAVVRAAARYAGDGNVPDRLGEVRSTYARGDDDPVAAFQALETEAGEAFLASLRRFLGVSAGLAPSRLQALNAKHALLFDRSGKALLLTETPEDELQPVRFSPPETIKLLYTDTVAAGLRGKTVVMKNVGEVWLHHPKRRMYHGLELAPNGNARAGYYNLWRGFAVEPKKGRWDRFRDHVSLIAGDNPEHVEYVLAWIAETIQHPDKPIGICLAFRGGQGTGKSTFAKWVGELFGPHFLHLSSEHSLLGHFNAHLYNSVLVFADEAVWAGGKAGMGALKRIITEDTLSIERKGLDVISVKNMTHLMVASNEAWFVPKELDDRRFATFSVSKRHQNDTNFFGAVSHQLHHEGGLAAFLHDMLEWKSNVNLKHLPKTAEAMRQKKFTMSTKKAWWMDELESGVLWRPENELAANSGRFHGQKGLYRLDRDGIYQRYVEFFGTKDNPGSKHWFAQVLTEMLPEGWPQNYQDKKSGRRYWIVPALEVCRAKFNQEFPDHEWEESEVQAVLVDNNDE